MITNRDKQAKLSDFDCLKHPGRFMKSQTNALISATIHTGGYSRFKHAIAGYHASAMRLLLILLGASAVSCAPEKLESWRTPDPWVLDPESPTRIDGQPNQPLEYWEEHEDGSATQVE